LRIRENFDNIQEPSIMMSMIKMSAEMDCKSPRISTRCVNSTPFDVNEFGITSI
jgi:hypothetical protein